MTYTEYLENRIKKYSYGEPIFTRNLAKDMAEEFSLPLKNSAAAVAVALKRIIENGNIAGLTCFKKGVYYISKETLFGKTNINKEEIIKEKYLNNENGYETGYALLYNMGLTTQIPANRVFATNKAKDCIRKDKDLNIQVCKPKTNINKNNIKYLQTLDAIELIDKAPIDTKNPYTLIANYIDNNKLDYKILLSIAGKHYNKKTLVNLAHVASERF